MTQPTQALLPSSRTEAPRLSSRTQAFYNMLCFTIGAGMLGLPRALLFSRSLFIVPVVLACLLCFYTAWLLHRTQIHYGVASYRLIGLACGGNHLMRLVAVTLSINQIGIAMLYVLTVCKNSAILVGGDEGRPQWWLYAVLAALTLIAMSRGESMAHISGMSFLGLISVVGVGLLVVGAPSRTDWTTEQCSKVSVSDALASLGTVIFAYGGHPVYPDVQGSMKSPSDFGSVLFAAFVLMTVLFVLVTSRSWQTLGCSVQGYILDDLEDSGWRVAAIVGMTMHLMVAIPVVLLPVMRVAADFIPVSFWLVRLVVVTMIVVVPYMFPFFSDFLALVGGLTENLLVLFFPIIFHYLAFGRHKGVAAAVHALDIVTLVFAATILVIGTVSSINDIVTQWEHRKS